MRNEKVAGYGLLGSLILMIVAWVAGSEILTMLAGLGLWVFIIWGVVELLKGQKK